MDRHPYFKAPGRKKENYLHYATSTKRMACMWYWTLSSSLLPACNLSVLSRTPPLPLSSCSPHQSLEVPHLEAFMLQTFTDANVRAHVQSHKWAHASDVHCHVPAFSTSGCASTCFTVLHRVGLPRWHSGKASACQCRRFNIRGSGRSPGAGNGNALQYSYLANPMDRGAWWGTVHGVIRVRYNWAPPHTHTHCTEHSSTLSLFQVFFKMYYLYEKNYKPITV